MKKILDETIVRLIWKYKVKENLDWDLCSEILLNEGHIKVTPSELKQKFIDYFEELTGVKPYEKCPKCGQELIPKAGKQGPFVGCSAYPDCKYTAGIEYKELRTLLASMGRESLTACPKCSGDLVVRNKGEKKFVACSNYPECKYIVPKKMKKRTKAEIQREKEEIAEKLLNETGIAPHTPCPVCGEELIPKKGRYGMFLGCSGYPKCKYIAPSIKDKNDIQRLVKSTGYKSGMDCPNCDGKIAICKSSFGLFFGCTNYPACRFIAFADGEDNNRTEDIENGVDPFYSDEPFDILDEDGNILMTINAKMEAGISHGGNE